MYTTAQVPTSLAASLAVVDGPGLVVDEHLDPVLCLSNLDDVPANLNDLIGGFAEPAPADLESGRSPQAARDASIEQLIAAR